MNLKLSKPKVSVSNFKNIGFRNIFRGFDSFEFSNLGKINKGQLK
jgi:hypothetical protein